MLLLLLLYIPAGPFTGHRNRSSASITPNPLHALLSHQPSLCPPSLHLHLPFACSSTTSILCPIYYPPYQTLLNLASLTSSPNCSKILPCSLLTTDPTTPPDMIAGLTPLREPFLSFLLLSSCHKSPLTLIFIRSTVPALSCVFCNVRTFQIKLF